MEIPPNILKELEEKKAQAVLSGAVEAPEKPMIDIGPIEPISPIGLIEAEPHKPSGAEVFFDYLTKAAVFLAVFLTPLFFFTASDTVNLPKQLLLSALAGAAVIFWVSKTIAAGKIEWRRHGLIWPMLAVALAAFLASVFSSSFWVSFLGDSGRYSSAGLSMLSYLILAVVAMQIGEKGTMGIKGLMGLWLGSVFLVSVYALLQFFGIHVLGGEIYGSRVFNPIGSPFALGLFALSTVPFLLIVLQQLRGAVKKVLPAVALVVQFAAAAIVDFRVGWIALAASAMVLILLAFRKQAVGPIRPIGPIGLIIIAALLWLAPPPQIKDLNLPAEVNPSYRASLDILAKTWKEKPVFGFGLETYPYAYSKFKSATLNQTNYWGVNFNDAVSDVVTWATTTGIFGTLAWLGFVSVVLVYGWRRIGQIGPIAKSDAAAGIFASWVFILFSKFFYPTPLPLEFLFWMLPIGLTPLRSYGATEGQVSPMGPIWKYRFQTGSVKTLAMFFVLLILLLGSLAGEYFFLKRWDAERTFVKAVALNDADQTQKNAEGAQTGADPSASFGASKRDEVVNGIYEAIAADPYEARYFRVLAQALFAKMNDVVAGINARPAGERQAKPEESAMLQNLTVRTINAVQRATVLDPQNVGVAVDTAESYRNLAPLVQGADDLAIQNYEKAAALEPVNPFIRTQLGQLYLIKSNLFNYGLEVNPELAEKARAVLDKAMELNPNYANARYFRALIQDRDGEKPAALQNFLALRQTNPDNQLIGQIVANIQNGLPALGLPPQLPTPPQPAGAAKGIPK